VNRLAFGFNWAIFSDLYGVWLPDEKHGYYEKHPSKVTESEFTELLLTSRDKLKKYDTVYFTEIISPTIFIIYIKDS
jgi:hypothetical protein